MADSDIDGRVLGRKSARPEEHAADVSTAAPAPKRPRGAEDTSGDSSPVPVRQAARAGNSAATAPAQEPASAIELSSSDSEKAPAARPRKLKKKVNKKNQGQPASRRRRFWNNGELDWVALKKAYPFVQDGEAGKALLRKSCEVQCKDCPAKFSADRLDNLERHEETNRHISALKAKEGSGDMRDYAHTQLERAPADVKRALDSARRAITSVGIVHARPKALALLFSRKVVLAAHRILRYRAALTSHTTVRRDLQLFSDELKDRIRELVKGVNGTVIIDGASCDFLGGSKPTAILFESGQIEQPLMLRLAVDSVDPELYDPHEDGSAQALADLVKSALDEYQISLSQVVCLMGDNAAVNGAVARILGVPQAKCLAHSFNLMAKHAAEAIPMVSRLTKVGSIIKAGGSKKRGREARLAYQLKTEKLSVYSNRFASALGFFQYLAEPVPAAAGGAAAGDAGGDADSEAGSEASSEADSETGSEAGSDGEDERLIDGMDPLEENPADLNVGGVCEQLRAFLFKGKTLWKGLQAEDGSRLKDLLDVYAQHSNIVEGFVYYELLKDLIKLIPEVSGNLGSTSSTLVGRIEDLGATMRLVATSEAMARATVSAVLSAYHIEFDSGEKAALRTRLTGLAMAAAKAAASAFEKHVEPALIALKQRLRFDPAVQPQPYDHPPAASAAAADYDEDQEHPDIAYMREWFGCTADKAVPALLVQWGRYVRDWSTISEADRKLSPAKFWQQYQKRYAEVADLGLWWSQVPTSAVAAERVFGIMRAMEMPNRFRMKPAAFQAEMCVRANYWLAEKLQSQALARLMSM